MKTIVEILMEEHIAENAFQAAHILNGLKCVELLSDAERLARCRLYRKWRTKTDKKNDIPSWQAYDLAIAGIDPDDVPARQIDMFASDSAGEAGE